MGDPDPSQAYGKPLIQQWWQSSPLLEHQTSNVTKPDSSAPHKSSCRNTSLAGAPIGTQNGIATHNFPKHYLVTVPEWIFLNNPEKIWWGLYWHSGCSNALATDINGAGLVMSGFGFSVPGCSSTACWVLQEAEQNEHYTKHSIVVISRSLL
jgi:hypothetical protein